MPSLVVTVDNALKIERGTRALLAQAVKATAFAIEAGAKVRAPVRTGNLRNSIQAEMTGELEAEVRVAAEYGSYVEHGTRHTPAQPFLTPAVEAERTKFIGRIRAAGGRGAR